MKLLLLLTMNMPKISGLPCWIQSYDWKMTTYSFDFMPGFDWMNLNEYKGWSHLRVSHHFLPPIAYYLTQQKWKCLCICNKQVTECYVWNFWSHQSLGRKSRFFIPLRFDIQKHPDDKIPTIDLCPVRALKWYLKKRQSIHGRETIMISKFSALIF